MTRDAILDAVSDFSRLPDDAIVPSKVTKALLGDLFSERTLRREPPIPRRQLSKRKFGFRAGDIRKLTNSQG